MVLGRGVHQSLVGGLLICILGWTAVRIAVSKFNQAGWEEFWRGNAGRAISLYETAGLLDPLSVEHLLGILEVQITTLEGPPSTEADLGTGFRETTEKCARILKQLIELAPLRPETWNGVADFYAVLKPENQRHRVYSLEQISLRAEENLEPEDVMRIRALELSIRTDPNGVYYQDRLGGTAWELGLRDLALEHFQRGIVLEPSPEKHLYLADWEVDPDIVEAVVVGMNQAAQPPRNANAEAVYRKLGTFLIRHERFAEAKEAFQRADEVTFPGSYASWQAYAEARQGNSEAAISLYRQALARGDLNAEARSRVHLRLGNLLSDLDKNQDAAQEIQRALVLKPRHARALLALGRIYESMELFREAEEQYVRATEVAGDRVSALVNLVAFYRRMGKSERALRFAQELVTLKPEEPVYREQVKQIKEETTLGAW